MQRALSGWVLDTPPRQMRMRPEFDLSTSPQGLLRHALQSQRKILNGEALAYLVAGLDGYVAKPLSPERLAEALRPHLRRLPGAVSVHCNSEVG